LTSSNGSLDGRFRESLLFRFGDEVGESGIAVGIAAEESGGCSDFLSEYGALFVFMGVGFAFVVFDLRPAIVTRLEALADSESA
jgi:hypothetical protein